MNHEEWIERMELSLAGEIGDEEGRALEEHLRSCAGCRDEFASLRRLHALIAEGAPAAPPAELLLEARRELRSAIGGKTGPPGWREFLFGAPATFKFGLALGAVALLAAGVIAGLAWPARVAQSAAVLPAPQDGLAEGGETRIANIRFINSDPTTGQIEFAFEAVKPVRMKGDINDERIQRVLSHAILNDQNVGVRLASISAVSSRQALPDREIKSALIAAVESDGNAGVRAEAMKALRAYLPDPEIKEALLYVLSHDENPALRITAINYLDSVRTSGQGLDENMLNVLRQTMKTDNNQYIRLRARTVMEEHRQ